MSNLAEEKALKTFIEDRIRNFPWIHLYMECDYLTDTYLITLRDTTCYANVKFTLTSSQLVYDPEVLIIRKINSEIEKLLSMSAVMSERGFTISTTTPDKITKQLLNNIYGSAGERKEYNKMFKHEAMRLWALSTKIEKVVFHDPATIVYWSDGEKTIVKAEGEPFDPEKGLAMAISKRVLGNKGNYYNEFKKWLPKDNIEQENKEVSINVSQPYPDECFIKGLKQSFEHIYRDLDRLRDLAKNN